MLLRIEFDVSKDKISLKQSGYINEPLKRYGMSDCKPVRTPIEINLKLRKLSENTENEEQMNIPYRELVGALTYLSVLVSVLDQTLVTP
ncbi:hypothetical protein QE152_g38296 [Popillia japonica]|uniref:Uncharacterized protein n=1 Tax=Popillia japonica TaxID=7064 RepID=A0AAW1I6N9_POPJA